MENLGRLLIAAGIFLFLTGAVLMLLGKFTALGHLPGDILLKGEKGSFYFPIVSCLIISVVLSILLNLFRR